MRRLVLSFAFAVVAAGTARADVPPWGIPHVEPAAPGAPSGPSLSVPIAFACNIPFAWPWSVGLSAWVGVGEHHAIRANFARYRGPLWEIIPNILDSEGPEEGDIPPDFGHTTDLSLGLVSYS